MNKPDNPVVLLVALAATVGTIGGGVWLLAKVFPGLVPIPPNQAKLTILGDTFSGYSTFRSQAFQDALKEAKITLNYQDEFDQAKRAELLNQGKADLLVTTLDQFLRQKPQGKIIGLIDRTVGADAVVLNTKKYPNLKSLLDLTQLIKQSQTQGQQLKMAFAGDTPSEYLALVLSTKFEAFKLSDFQINRVADAADAWKLLQDSNQNVAVAIIWEPYVTQARQQGYTVVLSSEDVPEAVVDVIVASNRAMAAQPDRIAELLATYYRQIDVNVVDTTQLQNQIAVDGKLSPNDAAAVLQGIEFFTSVEASNWLKDGTLEKRIGLTAAVLALSGRISDVPQNLKGLVDSELIAKAANNTQTLISIVRADNPELADRLSGTRKPIPPKPKTTPRPVIGNLQVRGEVNFSTGSAELTDEGKQTLDKLAQEIGEFNEQTVAVKVIGHTSQSGAADFNQTLSQQRSQVVVEYLRSRSLKHSFSAEGKGFNQPLPGVSPADSRNQRTEIRLVRIN